MKEIISFAAFAAFVQSIAEKVIQFYLSSYYNWSINELKNYCIVVTVASDTYITDRLATAWHSYFPLPLETVFYPKYAYIILILD